MTIYCIDTNSLIKAADELYPASVFKTLWARLDDYQASGRLISSWEVLGELKKKSTNNYPWANARKAMFLKAESDPNILVELRAVLAAYPTLTAEMAKRSFADPWVIATARAKGATVLTEEKMVDPTKSTKIKIPNVCDTLGTPCRTLLEMFTEENWVF